MLANCSLCGTEATLSFSANLVSSSFFAETWTILQALCCFWQHQQVCHFSFHVPLSDSCSVLAACPPLYLSFHLNLSDRSGRTGLLFPPALSGNNGSPDTRFSRGTTRLMSWPDGERYSCPLQSHIQFLSSYLIQCSFSPIYLIQRSFSPFISRINSSLFSEWRRAV